MSKHNIEFLYVTGDSFAFGQGLPGHSSEMSKFYIFTSEMRDTVYSGVLANKWQIPNYINTALPGGSNDRMARMIYNDIPKLLETVKPESILVHVGITHAARTEFYSVERQSYIPFISNFKPKNGITHLTDFWQLYVSSFDDEAEHVDRYLRTIVSMQLFLERLGVKYFFTRAMPDSHGFDNMMQLHNPALYKMINKKLFPDIDSMYSWCTNKNFEKTECHHYGADAHAAWADHLIDYMENNNIV